MVQSIDSAMAEALDHLNRIANHLRKHGQHKSANDIGKFSVMIVNSFTEGIENIPDTDYVMEDPSYGTAESSKMRPGAIQGSLRQQAVAALMVEMKKGQDTLFASHVNGETRSQLGMESQPPVGTWARVASAISDLEMNPFGKTQYTSAIPMGPFPHSPQSHSPDHTEIILRAPSQSGGDIMPLYIQELSAEPKAGIIRVTGKISKGFVQSFTSRVHEGPLYEIRIESAQSARVTFQYASHALAFLKSNDDMQRMLKYGRLGAGYQVELAELVDWNDDHRKMNQPTRERRRLSFARKKLFSEGLSPEKWRQDIRVLAGQNIDFLWVFNSGNGKLIDKVVLLILYQARADQPE
ncbi:hypothetical protein MAP00_005041 [Monascus purpureus]|nr:hypothetical protein MAP00_005041 [Monascus purpureus]